MSVTEPLETHELVPIGEPWEPLDVQHPKPFTEADYEALRTERYSQPQGLEWGSHGRRPARMDSPQMVRLLAAIEGGHFISYACLYAGLGRRTVHRWLERGEQDAEGELVTPYWHIWHAINTAKFIATHQMLAVITAASNRGSWRAAAWFMERSNPRHWGRNSIGHDGEFREWQEAQRQTVSREQLEARLLELLEEVKPRPSHSFLGTSP